MILAYLEPFKNYSSDEINKYKLISQEIIKSIKMFVKKSDVRLKVFYFFMHINYKTI